MYIQISVQFPKKKFQDFKFTVFLQGVCPGCCHTSMSQLQGSQRCKRIRAARRFGSAMLAKSLIESPPLIGLRQAPYTAAVTAHTPAATGLLQPSLEPLLHVVVPANTEKEHQITRKNSMPCTGVHRRSCKTAPPTSRQKQHP